MKLFVLRHAKTEPIRDNQEDFDRNLLPRGVQQIEQISPALWSELTDDVPVFCSTANRTTQTLDLFQQARRFSHVFLRNELYLASAGELLEFLNRIDGNSSLLLVGHNDGLSELVSYVTETQIHLSTGSFAVIDIHVGNWQLLSRGTGSILKHVSPDC